MRRRMFNTLGRFEVLEDRRMKAGDIDFDDHVLTIDGAGYNDVATVRFEGERVYVDLLAGQSGGGPDHHDDDKRISEVSKIVFNGFSGDDKLTVLVNQLNSGVTLNNVLLEFHGGEDNDQLINQLQGGIKTVAYGDGGRDILQGSVFSDVLEGGAGDDDLRGGSGDDRYVFSGLGLGHDAILDEAANADADTLDFTNFDTGTSVDLSAVYDLTQSPNFHYAVNSPDLQLRLYNDTAIENVIGTAFSDTIVGNARANNLSGGGQNDKLTGAGGDDTLDGGAGNDTYYFRGGNLGTDTIVEGDNADADTLDFTAHVRGVTVDLTKSGLLYAVNSTDLKLKLSSNTGIENVIGSAYDDTITGNGRDNYLWGMKGNDVIRGGAGADYLHGGDDDDQLRTDSLDHAFGEAGRDWFDTYDEGGPNIVANPQPGRYMDWMYWGPKPSRPEIPEIQH